MGMKKLLLAMVMTACGGSSSGGVDRSLLVVDMTDGEVTDECTYLFDNYPEMSVTCSADDTTTVGEKSVADCVDNYNSTIDNAPDCPVTVGQAEDCLSQFYDDPCAASLPASCNVLFSQDCVSSSSRKLLDAAIAHRGLTVAN